MARAAIKFNWRQVDRGWNSLRRVANSIEHRDSYVKVGVLDEGKGSEVRDGGLTNAELVVVHEFGSSDGRIPERSFVRSTLAAERENYVRLLADLLRGIYDQRLTVEKALNVLGARMATDIKKRVTAGEPIPPPNAPSTEAHKRRGKSGVIRTLVDTGRMIAAVSWLVVLQGSARAGGEH